MSRETQQSIPYIIKLQGVLPVLIRTAYNFATHSQLLTLLEEDTTQDYICQLLEILIILSNESAYFNIFIENQTQIVISICLNLM